MAEFIRTEEKVVNVGEPVTFENNTDSDFEVSAGIIFHKSGLYDVSIVGRRTIVSKVERTNAKERIGEWIPCSERLPEVEELVLVTDDSGGIKTVDIDRCGQYENSDERFWYYTQNAVAWMPLPEPYIERRKE